jgi:hypothetical protein
VNGERTSKYIHYVHCTHTLHYISVVKLVFGFVSGFPSLLLDCKNCDLCVKELRGCELEGDKDNNNIES